MPRALRHALRHARTIRTAREQAASSEYCASFRGHPMLSYYSDRTNIQRRRRDARNVITPEPASVRARALSPMALLKAVNRDIPGEMVGLEIEAAGITTAAINPSRVPLVARLQGEHCGVEVPLMARFGDWRNLRRVCALLRESGARVTRDCGGHVHIDVRDLLGRDWSHPPAEFKTRINRAAAICNHVLRFCVPHSRIGNRFCALLAPCWRMSDRYRAVNVCAIAEHGTVEIRLGAASLEPEKWAAWVSVCRWLVRHAHRKADASAAEAVTNASEAAQWLMQNANGLAPELRGWLLWRLQKFHPGAMPGLPPGAFGPESV